MRKKHDIELFFLGISELILIIDMSKNVSKEKFDAECVKMRELDKRKSNFMLNF
jgi:hypothetical protein